MNKSILMRKNVLRGAALLLGLSMAPGGILSAGNEDPKNPVVAVSAKAKINPVIDGDVLADPGWKDVTPISGFWQTTPEEGRPATEETAIRILHSDKMLYIGVVCYDTNPDGIVIAGSRRDDSLDESDAFQFILDTYNDQQNGFIFGTNPAGIEYDAQLTNAGDNNRGGGPNRQSGGSGGGLNKNWDGAWEVKTRVSSVGWSAEFAIPFKTLRFSASPDQIWGLNFQRNLRRRNETSFWSKLPRQYDLNRLTLAGKLKGLRIEPPKNLKVMPYALSDAKRDFTLAEKMDFSQDVGADIKYSITPSLTLDLTWNTDFAQVEVDEQQVNLNRFNLFFPEKRPFFLENAGLFSIGSPGDVELFFSRKIGIDSDGAPVPIAGGGRISGKVNGTSIGLLNMQTKAGGTNLNGNNFSVARVNREFANRTALGMVVVNRQGTGSAAPDNDYNRTFALDGKLGLGEKWQVSGFVAKTQTPELAGNALAYRAKIDYTAQAWDINVNYREVGKGFNPEVGFLAREEYRHLSFLFFNRSRIKNTLGLHEARPHVSYRGYWNLAGFQETGFLHVDSHWEFKSGNEVHTGVNFTKEGVIDSFAVSGIAPVLTGTYNHVEAQLVALTNPGAPVSFRTRITAGGFFGGSRFSARNTLNARFGEELSLALQYNFNHLNLPSATANINLVRLRASYSFTTRIYLQALLQYNDAADIWATNLRFGWLQDANTGFFLVYNETQDVLSRGIEPHTRSFFNRFETNNRSFILKYSRMFDVLN